MDHFRLKFVDHFPQKLHEYIPCILPEIAIMVFEHNAFFNCLKGQSWFRHLNIKDWYKWYYAFCHNETYHIHEIRKHIVDNMNQPLMFIPVRTHYFDDLDTILRCCDEYPEFGTDLPPSHQSVLVKYLDKFYYYDPEYPEHTEKLKELFGNITPVGRYNIQCTTDDNYCLLHTIMFMELAYKYPHELENDVILKRINHDTITQHISTIAKNLI